MTDQLASAVVVPQGADTDASVAAPQAGHDLTYDDDVPTGSKRRRSAASSPDGKRPRLSTDAGAHPANTSVSTDEPSTSGATDVPAKERADSAQRKALQDRERGREKRLFGGLFSKTSLPAPETAASRQRAAIDRRQRETNQRQREVDQRQKEKLRKQQEIADKEHLAVLKVRRVEQQKQWDEESLRLRHANMRAQARFLTTEALPPIYWMPYTITADQQRTIDRQMDQVEKDIERETEDFWKARGEEEQSGSMEVDQPPSVAAAPSEPGASRAGEVDAQETITSNGPDTSMAADDVDDDHVVEAGEDSVIY